MQLAWVLIPGHVCPRCITCAGLAERRRSWPCVLLEAAWGGNAGHGGAACGAGCPADPAAGRHADTHGPLCQRGLQSVAHCCQQQKVMHAMCDVHVWGIEHPSCSPAVLCLPWGRRVGGKRGRFRTETVSLLGILELERLEHLHCNGMIDTLQSC